MFAVKRVQRIYLMRTHNSAHTRVHNNERTETVSVYTNIHYMGYVASDLHNFYYIGISVWGFQFKGCYIAPRVDIFYE